MKKQSLHAPLAEDSIIQKQMELERLWAEQGRVRYRQEVAKANDRGEGASLVPVQRLMRHWFEVYTEEMKEEAADCRQGKAGLGRNKYAIEINLIKPETLAVIGMHATLTKLIQNPTGCRWISVILAIGRMVNAEVLYSAIRTDEIKWHELRSTNKRKILAANINKVARRHQLGEMWDMTTIMSVGNVMLWRLILSASSLGWEEEFRPAFKHFYQRLPGCPHRYKMVKIMPETLAIIEEGHAAREYLRPRYKPMITHPLPWTENGRGGYYTLRTRFVKKITPTMLALNQDTDRSKVWSALNTLGNCAWRINKPVLDVIEKIRDAGGGVLGVPAEKKIEIPPVPDDFDTNEESKKSWKRNAANIHGKNVSIASQWLAFEQFMSEAIEFGNADRFYLPHQTDFRGRYYPIPGTFSHHKDDVCRGAMEFAERVPVSSEGLRWIKIHAANCYGVGKESYSALEAWVDEHWEKIWACAKKPLDTLDWWGQADDPFQFLAACMALSDPEGKGSRLPVRKDGTCNGIQHYSAMMRDERAARSVNLINCDGPQDVYTEILKEVLGHIKEDPGPLPAQVIEHIGRSHVKRPVMTKVYGVSMYGASKQIESEISGLIDDVALVRQCARHLAEVTLNAMGGVCHGADAAMEWLTESAKRICKAERLVTWTSPSGLVVEQPYVKPKNKTITMTKVEDLRMTISYLDARDNLGPKTRKQTNAFAPNFIHSIDASHATMVACEMGRRDMEIAAIHDGFMTHAEHTGKMGEILKSTFVELHQQDILGDLYRELVRRNDGVAIEPPPERGDYDINQAQNSEYAFS